LILGDNIFYGSWLQQILKPAIDTVEVENKAVIFGNYVLDPELYGVASFDESYNVFSLEEKPLKPKSNYAVVGLYFYPNYVIKIAKKVTPLNRGELEITSVNQIYLKKNKFKLRILSRGFAWLDTGSHEA
jgi:glucose-1-phosphate thymidylyltransferase